MHVLLVVLLVFASVLTLQRAQRAGAAGARLRWLGLALSAAALVTALWTVTRMVADHDRAAPAADTSTRP